MVKDMQITSWKLWSNGLTLLTDASVTLADLSQAKSMTNGVIFFHEEKM